MKYLIVAFLGFALGVLSCSYEFHKQTDTTTEQLNGAADDLDSVEATLENAKKELSDKAQPAQKP
jgi:hypothetical protein